VIGFDSGVDSDIPVTTAATDNVAAAAAAADKMAELIGGEGEVAVIVTRPDQPHRHRPCCWFHRPDRMAKPIQTSQLWTFSMALAIS
jgi:hypothetical protein